MCIVVICTIILVIIVSPIAVVLTMIVEVGPAMLSNFPWGPLGRSGMWVPRPSGYDWDVQLLVQGLLCKDLAQRWWDDMAQDGISPDGCLA